MSYCWWLCMKKKAPKFSKALKKKFKLKFEFKKKPKANCLGFFLQISSDDESICIDICGFTAFFAIFKSKTERKPQRIGQRILPASSGYQIGEIKCKHTVF